MFSKESLPQSEILSDDALRGLANPGIAFLTKVWVEYGYLFTIMVAWKSLPSEDQARLLTNNPWGLCEWLSKIEGTDVRAFRHMFLYLCYPDYFERICSRNHKKRIHAIFAGELESRFDPYRANNSLCALDKSILEIRKHLQSKH
jgi:5-methylcytosine-specific restriction protein B